MREATARDSFRMRPGHEATRSHYALSVWRGNFPAQAEVGETYLYGMDWSMSGMFPFLLEKETSLSEPPPRPGRYISM